MMLLRHTLRVLSALLVLALAVVCWAWLRDAPPSAEVELWQQQVQDAEGESRAYLYLAGLDAPVGQVPEVLGRARLDEYQRWYAGRAVTADDFQAQPVATLAAPQGELFCRIEASGCFEALLAQNSQLPVIDAQYGVLRERYWQFLQLDDYRTLTSISAAEPVPPLAYLYKAQQLFNLHALQRALQGQGAEVQESLQAELGLLRRHLQQADSLVMKMLVAVLVNRNLEWQARLYRQGLTPRPAVPAPFTAAERSLLTPLQREFFGIAQLYAQLSTGASGREYLGLLLEFRPQLTINASLARYRQAAELSRLEADAFAAALHSAVVQIPAAGGLRNRFGNRLLSVGGPDLRLYAGRLQDLEAKRRLLATLIELPLGSLDVVRLATLPQTQNPYYPSRRAEVDGQGQLCFAGPLEDRFNGRCMPL